tara:strand:- start:38 stop:346 length:309 start_codon:yes stop_codon:yes gene_type:complete
MVNREEQCFIEEEVNAIDEDMLEHEKETFINKGHVLGQMIGENFDTRKDMLQHKLLEEDLLRAVERLVYIEMRLKNKSGWWFKSKTRIKFANMFRQNFKGHF